MIKNMLINLGRNKKVILNNFKIRVRDHKCTGTTQTLLNTLSNAVHETTKETNPLRLDDEGLEIYFLLQNWELVHGSAKIQLLYSELPDLLKELNK